MRLERSLLAENALWSHIQVGDSNIPGMISVMSSPSATSGASFITARDVVRRLG